MPVSFRRYIFVSPVGRGVFGSVGPWRPPTLVGVHGLALARGGGKLAVWPDSAAGCWGAAVTSAGEREITTGQWRQNEKVGNRAGRYRPGGGLRSTGRR